MQNKDKQEELASTVYIGGIPEETTSYDLKNIFITFGEVKSVEIPVDHNTGRPRGFAFVEYEDNEDAEAAIDNFDETELFGRIVKVKPAKPYKDYRFQNKAVWHNEEWQIDQHFTEKPEDKKRYRREDRKGGKGGKKDNKRGGERKRGTPKEKDAKPKREFYAFTT